MQIKKIIPSLLCFALIISSCQKNAADTSSVSSVENETQQLMSPAAINNFITDEINRNGEFNWRVAPDIMLWSAIMHSPNHTVSVGYKPLGEMYVEDRLGEININDARWLAAKNEVLQMIYTNEKSIRPSLQFKDLEVWKEKKLPVTDVVIENIQTIKALRTSGLIRYVEPMGYSVEDYTQTPDNNVSFGSGCGGYNGATNLIEGKDYTTIFPGCKRSWNYTNHGIPNAWTKSTGAGIKVMVIDTGESPDQENMGSAFNQGSSTGRTIEKMYTLPGVTNADDPCGHGTAMSSTVAAPRGVDGNSCGVAYNCNLVICRATVDVILDEDREIKGVSDAYTYGADQADIKIISMSLGTVTTYSQIKDAIQYAYSKGKLMFCAGGTSTGITSLFWGVIFPATMPEVQAITGVKNQKSMEACDICHRGPQIDFTIVMQQPTTGKTALCNAMSGDIPAFVGGSSVATATSAGIAALVWSKNPTFTREDVLYKMQTTASSYPKKLYNFGYGNLNADLATN